MSSSEHKFVISVFIFILCSMFLFYLGKGARTSDTKEERTRAQLDYFEFCLEEFKKESGRYPTMEEGLQLLTKEKREILDPWGSPYIYTVPSLDKDKFFSLYSVGPNKIDEKGSGDDIVCCTR